MCHCVTDSVRKMLHVHYERGYRFIIIQISFIHKILSGCAISGQINDTLNMLSL